MYICIRVYTGLIYFTLSLVFFRSFSSLSNTPPFASITSRLYIPSNQRLPPLIYPPFRSHHIVAPALQLIGKPIYRESRLVVERASLTSPCIRHKTCTHKHKIPVPACFWHAGRMLISAPEYLLCSLSPASLAHPPPLDFVFNFDATCPSRAFSPHHFACDFVVFCVFCICANLCANCD